MGTRLRRAAGEDHGQPHNKSKAAQIHREH